MSSNEEVKAKEPSETEADWDEEWRQGFEAWMRAEYAEPWAELHRLQGEIARLDREYQAQVARIPPLAAPGVSIMPLVYAEAQRTGQTPAQVQLEMICWMRVQRVQREQRDRKRNEP